MAVLSDTERGKLHDKFESDSSSRWEVIPLGRSDARGVIDEMDTKLDVFIDSFDTPPAADIAQLSLRQRLELIRDNINRRLGRL